MNQKNLRKKLSLNKLTISEIPKADLSRIYGGDGEALEPSSTDSPCPGSGSKPAYCITDSCPKSYPQTCSDNA
jgi:natural product precursor